ncbi:MAG TPA: DUF4190 domain-containing protein [Phycisphaerales bacterium]|nr:DUF4190 domain-containing protein [Phycisphaerales bacterium]
MRSDSSVASKVSGTGVNRPHYSVWAMAALLTSLAVICPLATLIGPLLAVRALVAIKANPQLRGRWMAISAIIIGLVVTVIWLGGAFWWHISVRRPMQEGPLTAFTLHNPDALLRKFTTEAKSATAAEADQFLQQVRTSLGTFQGAAPKLDYLPPNTPAGEFPISYILHGSNGDMPATAYFVVFANGRAPFVNKFRWIYVLDPNAGPLYFPPECKDEILTFINLPPASQPATASLTASP